jgi:uncharacterized protein (TIGR00730 family)
MKKIDKEHFRVAIFGSARLKRDSPEYKQVYQLAKIISEQNMDLVTGGGPGLMEAATKGHKEGRGKNNVHTFGLTISLPFEQRQDKHLDIRKDFDKFSQRLDSFMKLSNAIVVTPGGVGTLLELSYTWQLMQVKHICNIPIILIGDMWADFTKWIKKWPLRKKLLGKGDIELLYLAKNNTQVIDILKKEYDYYKRGGKNFCLNNKKYKIK